MILPVLSTRSPISRKKGRWPFVAAAIVLAAATGGDVLAQDAAAGARKSVPCQACHGLQGISILPDAPNLAAQPQEYLERSLKGFRSGERKNEIMNLMAKPLTDEDIRDLAAHFASFQIEVKPRAQ